METNYYDYDYDQQLYFNKPLWLKLFTNYYFLVPLAVLIDVLLAFGYLSLQTANSSVETSETMKELLTAQEKFLMTQKELLTTQKELLTTQKELLTTQKELLTTQKETKQFYKKIFKILQKFEEQKLKNRAALKKKKFSFTKIVQFANNNLNSLKTNFLFENLANIIKIRGGQDPTNDMYDLIDMVKTIDKCNGKRGIVFPSGEIVVPFGWNYLKSKGVVEYIFKRFANKARYKVVFMTRKAFCHIISTVDDILYYALRFPWHDKVLKLIKVSEWALYQNTVMNILRCMYIIQCFLEVIKKVIITIGVVGFPLFIGIFKLMGTKITDFISLSYTFKIAIATVFAIMSNLIPTHTLDFNAIDGYLSYPILPDLDESRSVVIVGGGAEFQKYTKQMYESWYRYTRWYNWYNQFLSRTDIDIDKIKLLQSNDINQVQDYPNVTGLLHVTDTRSETVIPTHINKDLIGSYDRYPVTLKDTMDQNNKAFKVGQYVYDDIYDLTLNTKVDITPTPKKFSYDAVDYLPGFTNKNDQLPESNLSAFDNKKHVSIKIKVPKTTGNSTKNEMNDEL
jgi:hypothetical protein